MTDAQVQLALVGRVVGTHGLRGDLKIRSHPENQPALLAASRLYVKRDEGGYLCLEPVRTGQARGNLLVRFRGHEHISKVEALVGSHVYVDPQPLRRLGDELYWFDLEGAEVIDRERGAIGRLVDMFRTAAHGIYVINGDYGEVLIPAVEPFVLGFDREQHVLRVDVPPGLYPDAL